MLVSSPGAKGLGMRLLICSLVPRSQGPGDEATDM